MRTLMNVAVSIVLALALIFGVRAFANMIFSAKPPARPAIEIPKVEEAKAEKKEEAKADKKEDAAKPEAQAQAGGEAAGGAAAGGEATTAAAQPAAAGAGDPAKGKKVFNKCKACHFADKEKNKVGPYLKGVVGRPVASVEGFKYSDALKAKAGELGTWTEENLKKWLSGPKKLVPGNKMAFAGLKKEQDILDVIAYLKSVAQ